MRSSNFLLFIAAMLVVLGLLNSSTLVVSTGVIVSAIAVPTREIEERM